MVEPRLLELGVGLIAAILVIREVLGFMGKMNPPKGQGSGHGNGNGSAVMGGHVADIRGTVSSIEKKVDDLYDWHAKTDSTGVPLWYLKPTLEQSIKKLTEQVDRSVNVQIENGKTLEKILQHMIDVRRQP